MTINILSCGISCYHFLRSIYCRNLTDTNGNWTSLPVFLMNYIWNEIEFIHMKFTISSFELRMEFKWTLMNFIWNETKLIHKNLDAVSMKFMWTSYRRTNEVNMVYPCNTNEVDIRLINSSREIHVKFIWISNDLNFMWTSWELHDRYTRS